MADPIQFDRKPYFISWKDENGEMRKIRRVPPPKLHEALPEDIVELTKAKSDDFKSGSKAVIKHINPRHPNTLQLINGEGQTTFVNYNEVELKEMVAPRNGMSVQDLPDRQKYLLWP
jgi:hypothetical protein